MSISSILLFALARQTSTQAGPSSRNGQIVAEVRRLVKDQKLDGILPLMKQLSDLDAADADAVSGLVNGLLVGQLEPKNRPLMLEIVRTALSRSPLDEPKTPGHWQTRQTEARILEVLDRHDEALRTLDETIAKTSDLGKDVLGRLRNHLALVGTPAPPLSYTKSIGRFPGLERWRGKVVILDFFAHWCVPCIAAFPEMKSIYANSHRKGLEILGVTELYGYYGARKELSEGDEYEAMKGFVKEKGLTWPVVFTDKKVKAAYRELGLPNVVVLDRKGTVREVGYGFYPGEPGKLRSLVERLLAEK